MARVIPTHPLARILLCGGVGVGGGKTTKTGHSGTLTRAHHILNTYTDTNHPKMIKAFNVFEELHGLL